MKSLRSNKSEILSDIGNKEIPIDYSLVYDSLKKKYQKNQKPIEVDFKNIISFHSGVDRHAHLLHPYPAKLLLNIPYFFINSSSIISKNGLILDPFCGSGTVLLESILSGHDAYGADSNPLARLITNAKSTPIASRRLLNTLEYIISFTNTKKILQTYIPQPIIDWDYWYPKHTQNTFSNLLIAINSIYSKEIKIFFLACFSCCAKKLSYADPNVSVPVKLNPKRYSGRKKANVSEYINDIECANTIEVFIKVCKRNINRINRLNTVQNIGNLRGVYDDARNLSSLADKSIDLIITSPPYAGAQKYIRSSSLSLGWLKMCPDQKLRELEKKNIGREHYSKAEYAKLVDIPVQSAKDIINKIYDENPLRAHIAANYLIEMQCAFKECYRVLKPGHKMILVLGNNVVCGYVFETYKFLSDICLNLGFSTELILRDHIDSRGLMTKRNKTASLIACEWILVLRK